MNNVVNLRRRLASCILLALACTLAGCERHPRLSTDSAEAEEFYREGLASLEKFYFVEAKSALQRAVETDSNFAMAYARLALLYQRSGNDDSARVYIERAVAKSAGASEFEVLFIRMLDHGLHTRHREALGVAESLTTLFPTVGEPYVFLGEYYEFVGQADDALRAFEKAVDADPSYAPAVMSLGYAYSKRGKASEAIRTMQRYIELVPDAADPRASFADILLHSGKYAEALEQYRASLQFKPDYWYSETRIGDVYAVLGRLNDAERQYEKAQLATVGGKNSHAQLLVVKGDLQLRRGRYEDALRYYAEAERLDSTNLRWAFGRVFALLKLNRIDQAGRELTTLRDELLRRNLGTSGAMLGYHLLRARLLQGQRLFEQALQACDSALQFGTELSRTEVYHLMAQIYLDAGNHDAALDALDAALRYNSNNPFVLLTLAKVYGAAHDTLMTREIGNRLLDIWKEADRDFEPLRELKQTLARDGSRSPS